MSKISEQKALEAYPKALSPYYDDNIIDRNVNCRVGYIKGYDQAMQDLLEKAEKFFNEELFTRFNGKEYHVASNKCMNLQQFIEYFKNYMQDEN